MPLIHVVDDNADLCRLLARLLRRVGYDVETFAAGDHIVSHASQRQASRPDLVILDFMMPGLNGLETLEALRLVWPAESVAIVMYTCVDDAGLAEQCLGSGADGYWVKNRTTIVEMERAIDALIRRVARRAPIDQPAAWPPPSRGRHAPPHRAERETCHARDVRPDHRKPSAEHAPANRDRGVRGGPER